MQAGFARIDITPPPGMTMDGYRPFRRSEAVHDELSVRALALAHDGHEAVILAFDLLFFDRPFMARLRAALNREFGLRPEQVLLNTSHTHGGPLISRWNYSPGPDPAYLDRLEQAVIAVTAAARKARQPATLTAGVAQTTLPVNRRKPDAAGKAQWAPYFNGPIWGEVPVCRFSDSAGRAIAVLFSVSCHPSMIGLPAFTADYPGVAVRRLNDFFQTDGCMFLQGAGGDTKPRQVAVGEDRWRGGTWDEMEAAGAEIAEAVITRMREPLLTVTPELTTCLVEKQWPTDPPPDRAYLAAVLRSPQELAPRDEWAAEMLARLDQDGSLPQIVPVLCHGVQLGRGLRLVGIEGELAANLGKCLVQEFSDGITFPLGYTNGCQLYLPSAEMVPQGGYEVDSFWEYHFPARLQPVGEALLAEAVAEMKSAGFSL